MIVVVVGTVGHAFLLQELRHGLRSHHEAICSFVEVSRSTEFGSRSWWCWKGCRVGGEDRVSVGVGVGGGVVGVGVVGVGVEVVVAVTIGVVVIVD